MSRQLNLKALALASLTVFAGAAVPTPALAAEVRVAAAASLTNALTELGKAWEAKSGHTVSLNFGASNLLARQIAEGAPADLFFSADEAQMDRLDHKHLLLAGSRRSLLSNTLAIVVPIDSQLVISGPKDLAGPAIKVLALAEPQTVPAGIYAKQYLRTLGLWSKVIDRVVPTENVRGALAAVEAGNADAAIVYHSDTLISKKVRVAFEVPIAEGPKISYPVAVLADAEQREAAKAFLDYLASPAAAEVFRRYGFLVPGAP